MAKQASTPDPRDWRWRPAEGQAPTGLQYEPGNWGDVLKGVWALRAAYAWSTPEKTFRYLDVYAGAPEYPLAETSRARLASLHDHVYAQAQSTYVAGARLASTATLVEAHVREAGAAPQVQVFDLDGERRAAWRSTSAEVLDADDALGAFDRVMSAVNEAPDLTLIDPYNLVHHWGAWLPRAIKLARRAPVLLYGYDKSPRGEGHADQYRRMAAAFDKAVSDAAGRIALCRGRVPADVVDPRAWHEMLLLGPAAMVEPLRAPLAGEVTDLLERMGE